MDEQVLIVGAGPVGMLLACELLAQGVQVRLVDSARAHSAHSRATIVWPRLLELLRHTDITPRLIDSGHPIDGVTYFSSGRVLGTAWMNRLRDTPYPFAVAIAQSETERIIEERLAELGGKVERGVELTELHQPDGRGAIAVLSGPDGGTHETEVSWLIGADGAHSSVRKLAGASFEGSQFDVSFAVTDAEITGDAPLNVVSYCYAPEGSLALGPLGNGICRVAVSVPHPEDDTPPPREFFQSIVDARAPGRNTLGELRFSTTFRVHARTAAQFRLGRCLLVGDAAHIMSPAGAQGMNTGLQDAVNLGWRLGGLLRGRFPESVLDGYDRDRRAAAHAVARSTALQTKWGLQRQRSKIAVRDVALRTASATGLLQRGIAPLVAQTGVRYPTTGGEARPWWRGGRVWPGERLPVLPVGSLDETGADRPVASLTTVTTGDTWPAVAADAFTVLLWPGRATPADWPSTVDQIRSLVAGQAVVVEPAPGTRALTVALGNRPTLAVVRPDGYLYALVEPARAATLPATLAAAGVDA